MLKTRGGSTRNSALTKQCYKLILLVSYGRKWYSGCAIGLKPIDGGSIPSFLVTAFVCIERRLALQKCGRAGDIREVIQRWFQ